MASGEENLDDIDIRVIRDLDDYVKTQEIQEVVWGFSDRDKVPPRLFTVATMIGGLALGAFRGERMVGFSLGMPGKSRDGEVFLHSHMTGVLAELQGQGLGARIKMRQREEAMALGFEKIHWTFDPLEIRNAYFNIRKLGVTVSRYEPNAYGITSSKLHGGLPTDRLIAEWRLQGPERDYGPIQEEIVVPADVRATPERAAAVQAEVRARFNELFEQGCTVVGFRRLDDGGGAYGLVRPID